MALKPADSWAPYVNISNTPTASTYPCIAADKAGNVHVLWSEDVGGKTRNLRFNPDGSPSLDARGNQINSLTSDGTTLFYTRWDGEKWLDPIDVQINPEGRVQYPQAVVDFGGILHVVWVATQGQQANLYYSNVEAGKAESANAWSKPALLAESVLFAYYPTDITADPTGGIHVLYSRIGNDPGAYIINSFDGGDTWSNPVELYHTLDSSGTQEGVSPTRMAVDSKGQLYATWTIYGADGNGKAIYYSRSQDFGRTWSIPMQVAAWQPGWYEVDWLSVGIRDKEIHLAWEGSSDIATLNERISLDGGQTWGESHQILANLRGENGFADYVIDSANQLHLLDTQRGDPNSITQGVWNATWASGRWQDPDLAGVSSTGLYAQLGHLTQSELLNIMHGTLSGNGLRYQRSAIVNGNELFVVVVSEWDGEIWASHTTLDAPYIAPHPFPQPSVVPTQLPTGTPEMVITSATRSLVSANITTEDQGTNVGSPILVGGFSVLFLIMGIALYVGIIKRINH